MKSIKKVIGTVTAAVMIISSFTVFAQSKKEVKIYYNFDNYEAESANVETPDEHWGANAPSRYNYGSAYDSETDSRVLKIKNGGEALLYFEEVFKTGKLHISFDIKTGSNCDMYIGLYNTRVTEDVRDTTSGSATQHLSNMFHYDSSSVFTFTGMGWGADGQKIENVDNTEWAHIDCRIGELSNSATRTLSVYRNGVKVNETPVTTGQAKAFKALYMRLQGGDDVYVDNVYVHRYYDDEESLGVLIDNENSLTTENAVINVRFAEPVETEQLTGSNVELIRQLDGYKVQDVQVVNADEKKAEVRVNEELQKGLYSLKINNVKARYSGNSWITAHNVRTKYEVKEISGDCYSDDFNEYTADGNAWPNGWVTDVNGNTTNSAAESVQGSTDSQDDKAFGMNVTSAVVRRSIYKLDTPINVDDALELSFDVKTSETEWGIYLLDEGTVDAGITASGRTDIVIGGNEGSPSLKYSDGKASLTADNDFGDECTVPGGEWHNVRLLINPSDGGSKYTVSVDSGDEYTAKVSRDFTQKGIEAIGVGFKGTAAGGTIAFDNIKVKSKVQAMCPEVDKISIVGYNGTEYTVSDTVPREVNEIKVVFNTKISAKQPSELVSLKGISDSGAAAAEYALSDDKTTISIMPKSPLDSNKEYRITVSAEVASSVSDEVRMGFDFTQAFKTEYLSGDLFEIYSKEFVKDADGNISFEVKIGKTDNTAKKYTVVIAGYDYTDTDGVTYAKMKAADYSPVVLSENDTGYFTLGADAKISGGSYGKVKGFIFEYPSMKLIAAEEMK